MPHAAGRRQPHLAGPLRLCCLPFEVASDEPLPMQSPRQSLTTRRLSGVKVFALLLALLLAQSAALTHAIAHARLDADSALAAQSDSAWAHQAGTASCQLVDQLLIGSLTGGDPVSIHLFWPAATQVPAPPLSVACGVTLRAYQARGPPRA